MSPRPRKVSDEEVFAAVYRVMQQVGPADLTLAAIGAEAGITAGALVQRFGSRRELMVAINARFAEGAEAMLAGIRTAHRSPVRALRSYAECFAAMVETPATLAHHLAYLEMDLSDPAMYQHVRRHAVTSRRTLQAWVQQAIAAGELSRAADPVAVARLVYTVTTGSMMAYPFFRDGKAQAWLRRDIEIALEPWLTAKGRNAIAGTGRAPRQRESGTSRRDG